MADRCTYMAAAISAMYWMFVGMASVASGATPCCPGSNLLNMKHTHCDEFPDVAVHINCNDSGIFILDPNELPDDVFTVDPTTGNLQSGREIIHHNKFCLARKREDGGNISVLDIALVCFPEEDLSATSHHYIIYSACLLVSSFFLLVTLIVYLLVPELRDLQGKCLMFSMSSLCLADISLAVLQLHSHNLSNTMCVTQAFFTYFWMLSAFFWLNVVSFNVWRTVIFHHFPLSDGQLLICFCVFAIGGPLLFLAVALATHHTASANLIQPNFGVTSCWFGGHKEEWAYLYGPMAVLLFLNTVYFIWTAWRLWKDCQGHSVPRLRSLRFKCLLYLKLFLVMGIPWIFEVISVIIDESTGFWLVMDILNCLQGLIIFLILVVFRKKALRGLVRNRPWGFNCPKRWAVGVDEESEGMLAEEEELSQTQIRN